MKEEDERQRAIENHEIFPGRDTAYVWEKHYEIWRHMGEYHFSIETEDASDNILRCVKEYDVHERKFYVIAEEGYAIVDEENYCRVYVTVPEEEFVRGYSEDNEGNREYISRKVESKYIEYLSQFEEFSEEERKIFQKMEN